MFVRQILTVVLLSSVFLSCGTLQMSREGRSAADQMLTAVSIQDALNQLDLGTYVKEKKVTLTVAGHSSEIPYIEKAVAELLVEQGAVVVPPDAERDLNLTVVVDSAGSDLGSGGLAIPIPLPSVSTGITISKIDLVQTEEQEGLCRLWVYGTNPDGTHAFTTDPVFARHWVTNLSVLGFSLGHRSDLKEIRDKIDVPIP
ncbi:MAG TPA: hypothetical protein PLY86_10395 [bacterium]|nr:hypothetical protein [bacterium]